MAKDLKEALERLEQALDEEELEEETQEEYEASEDEEYEEAAEEEYEDDPEDEDASPEPAERHGCLTALALILMTAIAVMLLIIAMKIKGLIP